MNRVPTNYIRIAIMAKSLPTATNTALVKAIAGVPSSAGKYTIVFQVDETAITRNDPWVNVPFHVKGLVIHGMQCSTVSLNKSRLNWTTGEAQAEWNKGKAKQNKAAKVAINPSSIL